MTEAFLELENVSKQYSKDRERAVKDIYLKVEKGEFIVFVGPSGCGKSTLLRMIGGLEEISNGTLKINNKVVNNIPPKNRDVSMVFQSYALYPHFTVYENMSFGLRLRKTPKKVIEERIQTAARMLQLDELLNCRPKELSGGQRQRVALGRAIVREPKIFLMDEPLSNLDAKLRVDMRAYISKLQQSLGVTTIYVTHDQVEAMTMGTRIVVINDGFIQQVDSPINLYEKPANRFVAEFIGSPAMNIVIGAVDNGTIKGKEGNFALTPEKDLELTNNLKAFHGKQVYLGVRPEDLEVRSSEQKDSNIIKATVEVIEPLGAETIITSLLEGGQKIVARVSPQTKVKINEKIELVANCRKLHAFEIGGTERNIRYKYGRN